MSELSVYIDFVVFSQEDKYKIYLADASLWGVAEGLPAHFKITPPGSTKAITLPFEKKSFTILTSLNLGLSCFVDTCDKQLLVELPDGVWEFRLLSAYEGLDKKRYFLKDDILREEIDKIRRREGINFVSNSQVMNDLRFVEDMLSYAKSEMKDGNHKSAKRAYDEASKITERYANCKDCKIL